MNTSFTGQLAVEIAPIPSDGGAGRKIESRAAVIEKVYDKYIESIYRFVYFRVGNREDAEDITSQVFIKAANSLDITQDERTRQAWLYQVARTTITDHWRHYYKGPASSLEAMEESVPLHLAAQPMLLGEPAEEEVDASVTRVGAILDRLPENYRRVLQFRFLLNYSLKETASAMSITEANVKVLQYRALQKAVKMGEQAGVAAFYS